MVEAQQQEDLVLPIFTVQPLIVFLAQMETDLPMVRALSILQVRQANRLCTR